MAKKLPIVEVEWEDSSGYEGWHSKAEHIAAGVGVCRSTGYLLKSSRKAITLVQSLDDRGKHFKVADSINIPRGAVKAMRKLS